MTAAELAVLVVPGERHTLGGRRKVAPVDRAGIWMHRAFVARHATRPIKVDGRVFCDACGSPLELELAA